MVKIQLKLMLMLKISPKFSGLLRYARRDDFSRHCEERSDVAIHRLLRYARSDG